MIDYKAIVSAVNHELRKELPYIGIERMSTEKQPAYPFFTYTVTSPYLNVKTYRSGGETQIEDVEIVISYTWISEDSFEALSLAQQSASLLKATGTRQRLYEKGLAVVRIDGFGSRDNFISIEVERQVGFDLRLRIRHLDVKEMEAIEEVTLTTETQP